VPLYKQARDTGALATGLCAPYTAERVTGLTPGWIYPTPEGVVNEQDVAVTLGGSQGSELLGFVIEDSAIGSIQLETWRHELCREGLLASCDVAGTKVYYQVATGTTREESLESDRHGSQCAIATQLGILSESGVFKKCTWLPRMNTPVFAEKESFGTHYSPPGTDFVYGTVPGTQLPVSGNFVNNLDFHTAILGVTGSGKTELAFDLIRHSVANGVKVLCIDLTDKYAGRLDDLTPTDLSIEPETADKLSAKLFEAETGPYGAGEEKKALKEFADQLTEQVASSLQTFVESDQDDARVGIISLREISNTKATLFITELFMSCLLKYAKGNDDPNLKCLVGVEEAHTVMPEISTMGLGDFDSRGLVGRISQIALQGRKYGVGLLVVAQRTATVTKTVLTQCNTVIALSSFDETTTTFLSGVFGRQHAELLRDLPALGAVVFGKAVRSERPIVIDIPYVAEKAAM
jgi:uncharacterized protein